MTTSRRALVLVIALLLVVGHEAALLHALSHLGEVSKRGAGQLLSVSVTSSDRTTAEDLCGDCLAYCQIATLAPTPAGASAVAIDAASSPSLASAQSANTFFLFAFLARAPPILL